MKMIKPIVNISKVMDAYDVILCGFNGVIYDGESFFPEAIDALVRLRKNGKKIVLVSNTSIRVETLVKMMYAAGISPRLFEGIVTVGEILHYSLAAGSSQYRGLGRTYYNLGTTVSNSVFSGLDYTEVSSPSKADFLYIGSAMIPGTIIDDYLEILSHSASLNIPLLCVGNDTSEFVDGEIALASGAIAEQYAVLGGKIITVGKPDVQIINYALEPFAQLNHKRVLYIGDNLATDIRAALAAQISSCLVSKGIHVNFLGEGYIPDITKTRELATTLEAFPDYVISSLRW